MNDKLRFYLNRLAEKLWVKPMFFCLISIAIAFTARLVDNLGLAEQVPQVETESLTILLKIISASMLVMAVFAVGTMLAAYQSASSSATPRAFTLVVSDDVSQNALSAFIGAFIFSIVAQVALINGYYGKAGKFLLFVITVVVFAIVIMSFIRWVDNIARLGRLSTTITKVENATAEALIRRIKKPHLNGISPESLDRGEPVYTKSIGYIQRLDMESLQELAEQEALVIEIAIQPGSFITPDRPLAFLHADRDKMPSKDFYDEVREAIIIGDNRTFDEDPRFGFITLSEIASRALSPAVNDPGTAIEIIGIYVRLISKIDLEQGEVGGTEVEFNRVAVAQIALKDIFEDAFNAIARDGAGTIEVVQRELRALSTLSKLKHAQAEQVAKDTAKLVFTHAEKALKTEQEQTRLGSSATSLID